MPLSRRDLAATFALTGAAAAFGVGSSAALATPSAAAASRAPSAAGGRPVKPKKLGKGSRVGLVLPASQAFEQSSIDLARRQLEAVGLEVVVGAHARARFGWFAGTDEERAADVNAMFADESIDGVYCYSGGWGSPRILPLLDYDAIARHPKVLIGYSDITALLNTVHQRTGLVTFHGPLGSSDIDPWTLEQLERVVFSADPIGTLTNPPKGDNDLVDRDYRLLTIRGGKASGRLVGGNLTMLASTMGTPYEVDTEGAILLLEDIHEAYYRIDRMLTQLEQGGKLAAAKAVVFGYCTDCPTDAPSFSFEQLLDLHFGALDVPVFAGLAFGHLDKKLTLPIGLEATVDADAGTLTIDEGAVV